MYLSSILPFPKVKANVPHSRGNYLRVRSSIPLSHGTLALRLTLFLGLQLVFLVTLVLRGDGDVGRLERVIALATEHLAAADAGAEAFRRTLVQGRSAAMREIHKYEGYRKYERDRQKIKYTAKTSV